MPNVRQADNGRVTIEPAGADAPRCVEIGCDIGRRTRRMAALDQPGSLAERLRMLTRTSRGTEMGRLLRQFWQPVALSSDVVPGKAKALRIMGEDLTLYRGAGGKPHLVGGRCAHRLTV